MIDISSTDDGVEYKCRAGHTQRGRDEIMVRAGGMEIVTDAVCLPCFVASLSKSFGMVAKPEEVITVVAPEPKAPEPEPADLPAPVPESEPAPVPSEAETPPPVKTSHPKGSKR
jgi:hypothetical protein